MSLTRALPALLFLGAVSCTSEPSSALFLPNTDAIYEYRATTALGFPLLQGTVRFESAAGIPEDPLPLLGTWQIDWAPGADHTIQVGPVIGNGSFDGTTDPSGVKISFTPHLVDAYVELDGTSDGKSVQGTWTYSSLMGPTEKGRFTLTPVLLLRASPE